MAVGSLLDRPATMRVKKMPIDSTNAEFWKVAIMPPAAPRLSGGTEFIISAQFGETNRPEPKPLTRRDREQQMFVIAADEETLASVIHARRRCLPRRSPDLRKHPR